MADAASAVVFFRLLGERAAADPAYLAWAVQKYAEAEGRPTADVLAQLGVAAGTGTDFLLSLRPAGDRFPEMLKAICARFGAHEPMLLTLLREVEVLGAFHPSHETWGEAGDTDVGLLMAARMRSRQGHSPQPHENAEAPHDPHPDEHSDGSDAH